MHFKILLKKCHWNMNVLYMLCKFSMRFTGECSPIPPYHSRCENAADSPTLYLPRRHSTHRGISSTMYVEYEKHLTNVCHSWKNGSEFDVALIIPNFVALYYLLYL